MVNYYQDDLAFIHDVGYGEFARKAAPGILDIFARRRIRDGLVVDLGCGSGLWAGQLIERGYTVLGIDISEAMIRLARQRAPQAEFRVASIFQADIPPCRAVTSLGECISYLFDTTNNNRALRQLFRRVYNALAPGGVFVFDVMEMTGIGRETTTRTFAEGDGWMTVVETQEDRDRLTRRITTFRKVGDLYRRADETHRVRLYDAATIAAELRRVGFRVRITRRYGDYALMKSRVAFIARRSGGSRQEAGSRRQEAGG
ncbi:MAG: class I SAM-dependent DNA methyltransferase [Blastocatellia bacterium]